MSRNFFQAKNYGWDEYNEEMLICKDLNGVSCFTLFDEGMKNNLVNAFEAGRKRGRREGEEALISKLKQLLRIPPIG